MSKHKSTDYKLTAVKYYLKGKSSLDNVCKIFNCSPKSLYRWVKKYKVIKTLQYAKYFYYAYQKDVFKNLIRKQSTLKRKLKNYKD